MKDRKIIGVRRHYRSRRDALLFLLCTLCIFYFSLQFSNCFAQNLSCPRRINFKMSMRDRLLKAEGPVTCAPLVYGQDDGLVIDEIAGFEIDSDYYTFYTNNDGTLQKILLSDRLNYVLNADKSFTSTRNQKENKLSKQYNIIEKKNNDFPMATPFSEEVYFDENSCKGSTFYLFGVGADQSPAIIVFVNTHKLKRGSEGVSLHMVAARVVPGSYESAPYFQYVDRESRNIKSCDPTEMLDEVTRFSSTLK